MRLARLYQTFRSLNERRKSDEGIDLVQLAFVLLLMLLIIGIGVPTGLGMRERGQDSQAHNAIRQTLSTARATVMVDNGTYPDTDETTMALQASEPQYTFHDTTDAGYDPNDLKGPKNIGVHVIGDGPTAELYLFAESASGKCFILQDSVAAGTSYATATGASDNPCTAAVAGVAAAVAAPDYGDSW